MKPTKPFFVSLIKIIFLGGGVVAHTIDLPSSLVVPGEEVNTLTTGINFGEGPAVDSEGNLYFSDRNPSRIWKLPAGGTATVYRNPANGANGMVFDTDDRLIVCEKNGITRTEKNGSVTTLFSADTFGSEGPNDLALTSNGSIFFTSSVWNGNGKVYYWDSETGRVKTILSFTNPPLNYPNGIEFVENNMFLYINITRKDSVIRYHLDEDMSIIKTDGFCRTPSPDGLAIDMNGNLWVANTNGNHSVSVFDPTGKKLGSITIDGQESIQNCAFGGLENKTLYITGKTAVFSLKTVVSGRSTTGQIPVQVKRSLNRGIDGGGLLNGSGASITLWTLNGKAIANYKLTNSGRLTGAKIPEVINNLAFPLASGTYYYRLRQDGVSFTGCTRFVGNSMRSQ